MESLHTNVDEALAQRTLYYSRKDFLDAREFTKELLGVDARTLDEVIYKFLRERKIKHDEEPSKLAKRKEDEVTLLGSAFYFGRKIFTTSHDLEDGTNPVPSIELVFETLKGFDNGLAAKFLEYIAGVSSRDSLNQQQVVNTILDILPVLNLQYSKSMKQIRHTHPEDSTQYKAEKEKLNSSHGQVIAKFIQYLGEILKTHQRPSLERFMKYTGNLIGNNRAKKQITENYVTEIIRTCGENIDSSIGKIEEECGQVLWVEYGGARGSAKGFINLFTGDITNPLRHQLNYQKNSLSDVHLEFFLGLSNRGLHNKDLPANLKVKTSRAKADIMTYLGRVGYRT